MAYASTWNDYGPQITAIAERIRQQYPADWANAHNHQPSGEVYIRRVAYAVKTELNIPCGLNWKRGKVGDLSQDILAFPNASGCPDSTHAYAGLELRDIIASAGSPAASIVYGDVTQATIDKGEAGGYVVAQPVNGTPPTIPAFPPRDETLAFGLDLNGHYRNKGAGENGSLGGRFASTPRHLDIEGEVVWLSEYLRRRQLGESHQDATAHVIADVDAAWPK